MIVGCPKETKNHEYRVGLTPADVAQIVGAGETVAAPGVPPSHPDPARLVSDDCLGAAR